MGSGFGLKGSVYVAALCAACGGGGGDAPAGHAGGSGGTDSALAGSSGAAASGGQVAGASGSAAMSGAGTGGAAASAGGAGVQSGAGGTAGTAAGAGGIAGATPPMQVQCNGMALPARAQPSVRPAIGPAANGLEAYWPTEGFRKLEPAMLGLDAAKLQLAIDFETPSSNTQAVVVVRHGYIAAEEYFGSFAASSRHESYSMAKSVSSALIGIAIGAGLIESVDAKLCQYYPEDWDCADTSDPRSRITIAHAMNISTGLRWSENWRSDATGTNDVLLASFNMVDSVLAREAVTEPGTEMRYSTGDPALLTGAIQQATGKTALAYAQEVLFGPIGIPGVRWNSDPAGRTTTYAGLQATAIEFAKFGYLYLNRGQWDGKQVVPEAWVDMTTQGGKPCEDWYRFLWHQNPPVRLGEQPADCDSLHCTPTRFADLPPDTFFAEGINGQFIFVMPSVDMVVVRLANDGPGSEHWDEYASGFLTHLLDAVTP